MHPVLAPMEVVGDVEMLVAVVEGVVVMATSRLRVHRALLPSCSGTDPSCGQLWTGVRVDEVVIGKQAS